ncbi:tRNA N(3)-methylcytidine methyltransferase METTL2 isoform X2 [Centruroides vittatus]|uniref:tRNA N(3)-methylcytidine methyltransferase METTL2 isoform X2 n=1 Tax=Centruroides vittatus TaxID=120091 RepID=UPI003510B9B5
MDSDRRPQFGNRFLENPEEVFQHNAWDNVQWDEAQEQEAKEKVLKNSATYVSKEMQERYEEDANDYWNKFYNIHRNRFFKDRHWLFTEFPELLSQNKESLYPGRKQDNSSKDQSPSFQNTCGNIEEENNKKIILEVGCGVGNTVFPLLDANNDSNFFIYCCDFSEVAISIVKNNASYDENRCHAFVWDITTDSSNIPFSKSSLDIITIIFVLSAINPDKFHCAIKNLTSYLKPGGVILFRDYGQYDMAELRFKPGHCLQNHFYVRGDGTRVYFFTQEEVHEIFTSAGLIKEQNLIDRRLQVNRGKLLKMYRVWIQCKYRKPLHS